MEDCRWLQYSSFSLSNIEYWGSLRKDNIYVPGCVGTCFMRVGAEGQAGTYDACFRIVIPQNKQEILL